MIPMGCQNEIITRNSLPSVTVEQANIGQKQIIFMCTMRNNYICKNEHNKHTFFEFLQVTKFDKANCHFSLTLITLLSIMHLYLSSHSNISENK